MSELASAPRFRYGNSLGRSYAREPTYYTVTFPISRYGPHQQTLCFREALSERDAVEEAEEFLSAPLTEEYFHLIQMDMHHHLTWEAARETFTTRGDCLCGAVFIERAEAPEGRGKLRLHTGS